MIHFAPLYSSLGFPELIMPITESRCRRIAAGVLIFSAILHAIYFVLVVGVGAVKDSRSSTANNISVVITTLLFIVFGALEVYTIGSIWLPLVSTIVNLIFTFMIIGLLMNSPLVAPVAWLVVWLLTDFACFATSFWLCWAERSKFPCAKGSGSYSKQGEAVAAAV